MKRIITIVTWLCIVALVPVHSQEVLLDVQDAVGFTGDTVSVDFVLNTDLTGQGYIAFEIQTTYNSNSLVPVEVVTEGSILESFGEVQFFINENSRTVKVTGANTSELSGTGTLFSIRYTSELNSAYTIGITDLVLNETRPTLNVDNGRVSFTTPPSLNLSPTSGLITKGETLQFSVSGGTEPYTYSSSDPGISSIDEEGLLTGVSVSFVDVTATDAIGITGVVQDIEVRGFRLSIPEGLSVIEGDTIEVPVFTTDLTGLNVIAGEVEFSLSSFEILGVEPGSISPNVNFSNTSKKISFASDQSIIGSGELFILSLRAGSSSTNIRFDDIRFNENLAGNGAGALIEVIRLSQISISPSNTQLLIGETRQFSASNSNGPLVWSVANEEIAVINDEGFLTALIGGITKVVVTDSLGSSGSTNITVFDGSLSISEERVPIQTNYSLPISLSALPSNRVASSFELDIRYSPTLLQYNGVESGELTDNWSISENDVNGNIKVAAASSTPTSGDGVLLYLNFTLLESLGVNQRTALSFNSASINEGSPSIKLQNGGITGANVPPDGQDTTISIQEDSTFVFREDVFRYSHPLGNAFELIRIDALPVAGSLTRFGSSMFVGSTIQVENLENLLYNPKADTNGIAVDFFEFSVFDGTEYSFQSNKVTFDIQSVNDFPRFTLGGDISLEQDFEEDTMVNVTPSSVPFDERSQIVVYSISPSTLDFAGILIDSLSGAVTISSIAGESGSATLTITADDGEEENNEFSQEFLLEILPPGNQSPNIEPQTFNLAENSINGTEVGTVIAADPDEDALTYTILNGNDAGGFALDISSGLLTVAASEVLDFETTPTFNLEVEVS
ncbi:MAG: Ig-like domain-containing protein, partial [Ekhidna sp.]|nr:Ig-like domain-containing protein [Ekhidna sp.]